MPIATPPLLACSLSLAAMTTAGCSVARAPLHTIEPTYSVREQNPDMAMSELWPTTTSLRADGNEDTARVARLDSYRLDNTVNAPTTRQGAGDLLAVD